VNNASAPNEESDIPQYYGYHSYDYRSFNDFSVNNYGHNSNAGPRKSSPAEAAQKSPDRNRGHEDDGNLGASSPKRPHLEPPISLQAIGIDVTVIDENTKIVIPCSELGDTADMNGLWSILMRDLCDPGYYDPSYDPDCLDRMEQVNYVFVDNKMQRSMMPKLFAHHWSE
jgi:hypothetical protein